MVNLIVGILGSSLSDGYSEKTKQVKRMRYEVFLSYGIELVVLDIQTYCIKTGKFLTQKQQCGEYAVAKVNTMPDVVWVRTSDTRNILGLLDKETMLFPSLEVQSLSGDKRETYKHFAEIQPHTELLDIVLQDLQIIKTWGDYVIVKPRNGYGGDGVEKVLQAALSMQYSIIDSNNFIVQGLCDFSQGYTGISNTNHDVRIVMIAGVISYCEVRTNDKKFKVNLSQGGTCCSLAIASIPIALSVLVYELRESFSSICPGCVAFDFGFDADIGERQLIEINDSPGFLYADLISNKRTMIKAFDDYAKYFVSVLNV